MHTCMHPKNQAKIKKSHTNKETNNTKYNQKHNNKHLKQKNKHQ